MKTRELGELGLRLLGVYLLVQVVALLPTVAGYVYAFSSTELQGQVGIVSAGFLPFSLLLLSAFALLIRPSALAERVFPNTGEMAQIRRDELEALAFATVGVLVFASSIPGLVGTGAAIVAEAVLGGTRDFPWRSALSHLTQTVLGLVLFFRASAVAALWRRKNAGAVTE